MIKIATPTNKVCYQKRWVYGVAIAGIVLVGLHLRLSWFIAYSGAYRWGVWKTDEYQYYYSTAENAFAGRGFVPAYNNGRGAGAYVPPPMQPLFILSAFYIAGPRKAADLAKLLQIILCSAMIAVCILIGWTLVSPLAGLIFGFGVAVYPDFVYWTAYLMTESNYMFGLSLLLLLLLRWTKHPGFVRALHASIWLGVINLQRPNALFLGPFLSLFTLGFRGWKRGGKVAVTFLLVPMLVLSPWLCRNLIVYKDPIWVNSNGGFLFHLANREGLDASKTKYYGQLINNSQNDLYVPEIEQELRHANGELKVTYYRYSETYFRYALSYVIHHPVHFLKNYAIKFINQFYLIQDEPTDAVAFFKYPLRYTVLHWLILVGGVAGLITLVIAKKTIGEKLVFFLFLYFACFGALFHLTGDGRMTLPLRFFLMMFFAKAVTVGTKWLRQCLSLKHRHMHRSRFLSLIPGALFAPCDRKKTPVIALKESDPS